MKRNPNFGKKNKNQSIIEVIKGSRASGTIKLSNRELENLPEELFDTNLVLEGVKWWEMVDTVKMDCSFNQLTAISYPFDVLGSLQTLRFSNNKIEFIPDSVFKLQFLKAIEFDNNEIKEISEEIGDCLSLVVVNLENNKLRNLPQRLKLTQNLEILNLRQNLMLTFPLEVCNLRLLKKLDLSNNKISILPNEIAQIVSLEELTMQKCGLERIETGFAELTRLKTFDFSLNKLEEIQFPASEQLNSAVLTYNQIKYVIGLEKAVNLTVLDLYNNKIKDFPLEIVGLTNLNTLSLGNNDLNEIPFELGFMKALVRIGLEGNPLRRMNDKIRSGNAEIIKKYLRNKAPMAEEEEVRQDLDFFNFEIIGRNLNLRQIPDLSKFTNPKKIDLSFNKIENLKGLESQMSLVEANFESNELRKVSALEGEMLLESLNLAQNKLCDFLVDMAVQPDCGLFYSLKHLNLSRNILFYVPQVISRFYNLNTLVLNYNRIQEFALPTLQKLTVLEASSNKIQVIDPEISLKLPSLVSFNVSNNDITRIPTEISLLPNLQKILIEGNPLKQIRYSIVQKGPTALLDYLKSQHVCSPEEEEQLTLNKEERLAQVVSEIDAIDEEIKQATVYSKKHSLRRQKTELIKEKASLIKE